MAQRRWTDEQLSAINTRDKTLLVSAAAGSGKTATLTERVIRSLTDPNGRADITSLLAVTFTNAAASELRLKISAALEAAVAERPCDKELERQLYLLPAAEICTIDSFCNDVVRKNADKVGLVPNYRIADTAELAILESSLLEGLIDAVYDGELSAVAEPEAFEELCDCLTDSKRTEELSDVFRFIYDRTSATERGVDSLLPLIEEYNPEKFVTVQKTRHGSYLMERVRELCRHYRGEILKYRDSISPATPTGAKYRNMATCDAELLESIERSASYGDMRERMCSLEFSKRPPCGDDPTGRLEELTELRDLMKKELTELCDYFKYTEEHWCETYRGFYRVFSVLYRFLSYFDGLYREEKRRRAIASYNDIERYAYEILWQNGERTDVARSLRERYSAVYIDEYQDVNSLQNRIFEAVSRPDNRFMVGDIKQSIYGFRSAKPEIFAGLKSKYPPLESAVGDAAAVFMSRNFRCDEGIVDFVNSVFDRMFSLVGESIGYSAGDRLVFAKSENESSDYRRPTVCMLDKGGVPTDGGEAISEPRLVAMKISELLRSGTLNDGTPVKPSDIAIIMRNARGHDKEYAEALGELSVPCVISDEKSFFLSKEVLLALCLLNSIDNPRRDIYLAGLMCSPLYSFTPDELYLIRHGGGGETLYEDLTHYVEANPDYAKGRGFLDSLAHYRAIAEGVSADKLIYRLYSETALLALAARSGGKDNLMLLYDYARSFSAGSYKGLYSFLSFINGIVGERTTFDDNRESAERDAVEIITCHSSKGLEYPIVFLVETGQRFTNHDAKNRLAYAEDFGISVRLRTPSGLGLVNNPVQGIINHYLSAKNYEEELRILYVALTRAREQLYVTGECPKKRRGEYERRVQLLRRTLSSYSARALSSYLEILLVAGDEQARLEPKALVELLKTAEVGAVGGIDSCDSDSSESVLTEESVEEYVRRFTYEYPDEAVVALPEKMSVSKMSPGVLDGTDEPEPVSYSGAHTPAFILGAPADESARRGVATHYFMQFCDLENLARVGVSVEIERLVAEKFISPDDSARIRREELEAFSKSRLFSDMIGAKGLWRELRFNVRLPARIFTEDSERAARLSEREILVQGVIDCIVEYPDGRIGVFDYKTDRLTRDELCDPALAEAAMRSRHENQLYYYSLAVEKMFGKAPDKVEVYSLHLGRCVNVKREK